jgi:hypothetical protein
MNILLHAHSGLRWILLIMLVLTIVYAYRAKSSPHIPDKKKINLPLYTLILFAFQFVLGLVMYFMSGKVSFEGGFMKDSMLRFFTVEHGLGMIAAIVLIHVGYIKSTKLPYAAAYKAIFIYYLLTLLLVLVSIPWPFRGFGTAWF